MAKGPSRDSNKERHWRQVMARWRPSGLGVRAFCRRHRLKEASFYFWRRELARRGAAGPRRPGRPRGRKPAPPLFLPVAIGPNAPGAPTLEVDLPGDLTLRVPLSLAPETLGRLVAALRSS